jgi:hypothetical protein
VSLRRRVRVLFDNNEIIILAEQSDDFGPGVSVARVQNTVVWGWRRMDLFCECLAPLDESVVAFAGAWDVALE